MSSFASQYVVEGTLLRACDLADTSIKTGGPEGNPFYNIHWLAKEDIENQTQTHNHAHTTNMAHSPPQKLW